MRSGNKVAYEKVEGSGDMPTVLFIPGFMAGKDDAMPMHLRKYCVKQNYTFVRYDHFHTVLWSHKSSQIIEISS